MAGLKDIGSIWKNVREVDLRPIREDALHEVRIAIVGQPGAGRHTLAAQMRRDPNRPGVSTQSTLVIVPLDQADSVTRADLIVVMVDATSGQLSQEQALVERWNNSGRNVLVFCNKVDLLDERQASGLWAGWQSNRVLYASANDSAQLLERFVPRVLEALPGRHVALGRQFPLFRLQVARQLIGETCLTNTAYAISTGLAEIVPILDIPLNITDMIVLTKAQAFLAYKLGLLLGFSTRWQDYVTEFGSVIGGGFLWRQLARQLVGLIPVWGIVPKVAVSYAGTYVVGNAVLGWYLTGRHLSARQMRDLYLQAFARGKENARKLIGKLPHRAGKPAKPAELPASTDEAAASVKGKQKKPKEAKPASRWGRSKKPAQLPARICPNCGKSSATDASFCQYCGSSFDMPAENL